MGINSWLEDELFQQYQHDRTAVDDTWKQLFESGAKPSPVVAPAPAPAEVGQALSPAKTPSEPGAILGPHC